QNEIIVGADLRERAVEHVDRRRMVPAEQLVISRNQASWRIEETFPGRVITRVRNERANSQFRLGARRAPAGGLRLYSNIGWHRRSIIFRGNGIHNGRSVRPGPWQSLAPGVSPGAS